MADRLREVVGKHSTYYVCDEHGWDFTNVDKDVCPVCYGESLAEERIIKLLDIWDCNNDRCDCDSIDECVYRQKLIALIKGEK
jgi:hypothetical protein